MENPCAVGGLTFSKDVRIETVVPNRLKIQFNPGRDVLVQKDMPLQASLTSQWLHGAPASGLNFDVKVRFSSRPTRFARYQDHVFDDPAREFFGAEQNVFKGKLDEKGEARFPVKLAVEQPSPGALEAAFLTRVFEETGEFSSDSLTLPFHPYQAYAGIKTPQGSHFNQPCLLHQLVHLDRGRRFRVDSSCLSVEEMVHEPWFVLPPVQEFYYRRYHPEYRVLPPFRSDCGGFLQAEAGRKVMSLVYPEPETSVFIPIDLDGRQGQVVFEAVHRDSEAVIYWHLDENYLGSTRHFHQVALRPDPGEHRLILVDYAGRRLERSFRVLHRTAGSNSP
jgi:hypothetical protein